MTCVTNTVLSTELWRFDTSTLGWERVDNTVTNGTGPSAISGHVMTSVGLDLWVVGWNLVSGEGDVYTTHSDVDVPDAAQLRWL